jgi:hypothetical protein
MIMFDIVKVVSKPVLINTTGFNKNINEYSYLIFLTNVKKIEFK